MRKTALALAIVFGATACGGGGGTPAPAPIAVESVDGSSLPAVSMVNVATGESVNLASFGEGDKPLLLWFWAPH